MSTSTFSDPSAPPGPSAPSEPSDRVALVLSGGGVYGAAQIGMLEVLENHELLQDVDVVIGTSAGAVVGAALARGYTPTQIWDIWSRDAWDNAQPDDPRPLARVLDVDYAGLRAGLFDDWRRFEGFIRGEKLLALFHRYLDDQHPERRIEPEGQPRRLYAVAVDVEDGREVIFHFSGHLPGIREYAPGTGREAWYLVYHDVRDAAYNPEGCITMADAVRASISLPVAVAPYPLSFRRVNPATGQVDDIHATLVDGAVRDYFPVSLAVKLAGRRRILGMFLKQPRYVETPLGGGLVQLSQRSLQASGLTIFEADQDDGEIRTSDVRVLVPYLPPRSGVFDPRSLDASHAAGRRVTIEFLARVWHQHGKITWDTIFALPGPAATGLHPATGRAGPAPTPSPEPAIESSPPGDTAPCPPPPENYYLYYAESSPAPPEPPSPPPGARAPTGQRALVLAGLATAFLAIGGLIWLFMNLVERQWGEIAVGAAAAALVTAALVTGAWNWIKGRIERGLGG